jgi:hypothetical protein
VQHYEDAKRLLDTMNEAFSLYIALQLLMIVANLCHYLSSLTDDQLLRASDKVEVFFHLTATLLSLRLISESASKVILAIKYSPPKTFVQSLIIECVLVSKCV